MANFDFLPEDEYNQGPLVQSGEDAVEHAARTLEETRSADRMATAIGLVPGSLIGAVDTIAQSIGLANENSISDSLSYMWEKGGEVYKDNKDLYQGIGDIGTLFLGAGVGTKLVRAPGYAMKAAAAIDKSGKTGKLLQKVIYSDIDGVQQLTHAYKKATMSYGSAGIRNIDKTSKAGKIRRDVIRKQLYNDIKEGVAQELTIYGLANQSELLFGGDQTFGDMATMAGIGVGVNVALGRVFLGHTLKKVAALGGVAGAKDNVVFNGHAGSDIVTAVEEIKAVEAGPFDPDAFKGDAVAKGLFYQRKDAADKVIVNRLDNLNTAPMPEALTPYATKLDSSQLFDLKDTIKDMAIENPNMVSNITAIKKTPAADHFINQKNNIINKQRAVVEDLDKQIVSASSPQQRAQLTIKRDQARKLEQDMNTTYVVKFDSLGIAHNGESKYVTVAQDNNRPSVTKGQIKDSGGVIYFNTIGDGSSKGNRGISIDGSLTLDGKRLDHVAGIDPREMSKHYASIPKAVNSLVKDVLDDPTSIIMRKTKIDKKINHVQADYLIAALKHPKINGKFERLHKVFEFSNDVSTLDDLKYHAMRSRFETVKRALKDGRYVAEDITALTNLRFTDNNSIATPVAEWLIDVIGTNPTVKFDDMYEDFGEVIAAFSKHYNVDNPSGAIKNLLQKPDKGKSDFDRLLHMNMVEGYTKPKPAFAAFIKHDATQETKEALNWQKHKDIAALNKQEENKYLNAYAVANEDLAPHLKAMDDTVTALPELEVGVLDAVRSATQSAADSPLVKSLGHILPTTVNFRTRHMAGAQAASALSDSVFRAGRAAWNKFVQGNTENLINIRKMENKASYHELMKYWGGYEQGWRLADDAPDAQGRFVLSTDEADAAFNNKIALQAGLKQTPEFMPDVLNMQTPLILDKLAQDALAEVRRLQGALYVADNGLANYMGKAPVAYRKGHVPAPKNPNIKRVFIRDMVGKVVSKAEANTLEAARKQAENKIKGYEKPGAYTIVDESDVEQWHMLNDRAWNEMIDPGADTFAQQGKQKAEGGRTSYVADPKQLNYILEEIENQFNRQQSRYMAAKFKGELSHLETLQTVGKEINNSVLNGKGTYADGFDLIAAQITGSNPRKMGNIWATFDAPIEAGINAVLDPIRELYRSVAGESMTSPKAQKLAKEMSERYGYDPVEYADSLLTQQQRSVISTDARKLLRASSSITQTVALKFMEIGHGLLTWASMFTTTPHMLTTLQRIGEESEDTMRNRLGYMYDLIPAGQGQSVPVFNASKAMINVTHKLMKGGYNDVLKEATKKGYLEAQIGEFYEHLGSPVPKTKKGEWAKKLIDKSGYVSMRAEKDARTFAFLTAYEMFHGIAGNGKHISMAAANDMANKVIADYRPSQKGELFRGATGIPLGLFQTFSVNYFEKLYSAIENKDVRSLATRYATQGFVFGGSSVAGYDFFNEVFFNNYDNSHNPEQWLTENTDKGTSDLLLYGTLSNLPKLLGLDGIALYTRGELQTPKVLTPYNLDSTPVVQMATRSKNALSQGFGALMQEGGLGIDALRENAILATPSRPLRGIMEIAQGYSTNLNGDLMEEDTRKLTSIIARSAGLRPMQEAKEAKALWLSRQGELARRARKISLRHAAVAAFRSGKVDDVKLGEILERYIAEGGSPRGARQWLKEVVMKAQFNRFDRELVKALKKDPRSKDALRFLGVSED